MLRRATSEMYLHVISAYLRSQCSGPEGELYSQSFQKLDLLHAIAQESVVESYDSRIFEIACHPAKDTDGLEASKLIEKRRLEYDVMRTGAFVANMQRIGLCSFSDLDS